MSQKTGKPKGSAFEREMCKRLSTWWSGGASSQVFWRNSGFLARGPGCQAHQYGDVHSINERGEWFTAHVNVELKFYRNLELLDIVDKPEKKHVTLLDHWAQCIQDAVASKREPLLIAKRNFAEPFVMCYADLARELVEDGDTIVFYDGDNYVAVFILDLMEANTAEEFKQAYDNMVVGRREEP